MALTPTKLGGKGGRPGLWAPAATGVAQGSRAASMARSCRLSPSFSTVYTSARTWGSRQTGADAASPTCCGTGRSGCPAPTSGLGQQPQQLRCERLWGA